MIWNIALADVEGLTFERSTEFLYAVPTSEPTPWVVAALKNLDAPDTPTRFERFGLILICTGVEDDGPCDEGNCLCVGDEYIYRGYRFWQEDDYGAPNAGVRGRPARVLISGGGDSGLQDLIRILLAPVDRSARPGTPRDLLRDVEESGMASGPTASSGSRPRRTKPTGAGPGARRNRKTARSSCSSTPRIARSSARSPTPPGSISGHGSRTGSSAGCRSRSPIVLALRAMLPSEPLPRLAPDPVPRRTGQAARRREKQLSYLPEFQLAGLAPADGHAQPCHDPVECHGKEHHAILTGGGCLNDAARAARRRNDQFNVVIVRHGPGDVCGKPRRPAPPPIRQVLPYFVEP